MQADTISHYGYTVEKHYVTTDDGYTVQLQRIPVGRDGRFYFKITEHINFFFKDRSILGCSKRPVVFFMHGLFGSSYHFLLNLPSQSAAYIFADAGFDVWLGNIRGTEYGLNHTSFSTNGVNFWNFRFLHFRVFQVTRINSSLYEHSHYDLRQQIEYVLDYTRHESLFYVGHSQGTAVMFARLAEADVTWQSKIRVFFALGPTAGFMKPLMPFTLLEENYLQALIQVILN